ncbi:MAG: TonB-dependent receptor, partial [Thermaurantiacus sp.]
MNRTASASLAAIALVLSSAPAAADDLLIDGELELAGQETPPAPRPPRTGGAFDDMMPEDEEILVTVGRLPGQVVGTVQPEIQLDARDIRAFGAASLADLLQQLGPQLQSGAGRGAGPPLVLLNGQRVSGFQEIRNYPPEAILRVDILPEEAALAYGARPNQRVINFVLRPRFQSVTVELEGGAAASGNRPRGEVEANLLRLRGGMRLSLEAEHERQGRLLESERNVAARASGQPFAVGGNIVSTVPGAEIDPALSALAGAPVTVAAVPDSAAGGPPGLADFVAGAGQPRFTDERGFRTLLAQTERTTLGGTIAGSVAEGVSASVNARLELSGSESLLGLSPGSLVIPGGNPFSPFAGDVALFRLDPA